MELLIQIAGGLFNSIGIIFNKIYLIVSEQVIPALESSGVDYKTYLVIAFTFLISIVLLRIYLFKRNRKGLIKNVTKNETLSGMKWDKFEHFVSQFYKENGYRVTEYGGNQADGGIDLVVAKGKEKKIVQVKYYNPKNKISVSLIREMLGVFNSEKEQMKLTGVAIVTSSSFTKPAIEFGKKNNVELISGIQILNSLGVKK
jgi:HJR/Mrr/RecB family endonuclease